MAGHSEGHVEKEFCALRKDDCGHNKYREVCKPSWTMTYAFLQGRTQRTVKDYEAHHLVCIASVTQFIAKSAVILPVVQETKWCVNAKSNMLAMPLWGHTIQWYCDLAKSAVLTVGVITTKGAPKFENIPMHDYDHNSKKGYKQEVDTAMEDLADQIKDSKKKHENKVKELKSELDAASDHFRSELDRRGSKRAGGTHKAWQKGMTKPTSDWYKPFSMANDGNEEARTFPSTGLDSWVADKLERLAKAFLKWG